MLRTPLLSGVGAWTMQHHDCLDGLNVLGIGLNYRM